MMNEEKIDMLLKNALSPVAPDERMNQRLKQELEGKKMKKWNAKKDDHRCGSVLSFVRNSKYSFIGNYKLYCIELSCNRRKGFCQIGRAGDGSRLFC